MTEYTALTHPKREKQLGSGEAERRLHAVNNPGPQYKSSSIDSYLRKLVDKGYLIVVPDIKPRRYFVSEVGAHEI